MAMIGAAGALAACGAWLYSYQEWLKKNRPGKLASDQTPLRELSDLTKYVTAGELGGDESTGECPGCHGRLTGPGPFAIADGKLWHPEHTACPECVRTGETGSAVPRMGDEDGLWCTRHYGMDDVFNCSECRDVLTDTNRTVQPNGDVVCTQHAARSECYCCGRLTAQQSSGAAFAMSNTCSACAGTSVCDIEGATELFHMVAYTLATDFGVDVGLGEIDLRVGSIEEGRAQYVEHGGTGQVCVAGLTRKKHFEAQVGPKRVVVEEVDGIWLQAGLPKLLLSQVIAHELMHAWVSKNKLYNLPTQVEEGLCEVVSYLWLTEHANRLDASKQAVPRTSRAAYEDSVDDSEALKQALGRVRRVESGLANPGLYADGFRDVLQALQGRTFSELLDFVKKNKALPPALFASPLVNFQSSVPGGNSDVVVGKVNTTMLPEIRG